MTALLRRLPRTFLPLRGGMEAVSRIDAAFRLRREREDLGELGPHLLQDVGLTKDDVRRERERPVWDAPGWWHGAP